MKSSRVLLLRDGILLRRAGRKKLRRDYLHALQELELPKRIPTWAGRTELTLRYGGGLKNEKRVCVDRLWTQAVTISKALTYVCSCVRLSCFCCRPNDGDQDLRSESALVGDGSDQASAMDVMTSALSKVQKWIDQLIRRKATPSGELAEEKEVKQVGRRDAEVESTEAALSELSATISAQLEELARLEEDAAKLRFELESRSKWEAVRLEVRREKQKPQEK